MDPKAAVTSTPVDSISSSSASSAQQQPVIIVSSEPVTSTEGTAVPLALLAKDSGKQRAAAQLLEAWNIASWELFFGDSIGAGGQADVFAGSWRGLPVAIKKARGGDRQLSAAALKSITQTVRREVRALARVRNPNVIRLYGACMEPAPCLVMALAPNGSLESAVAEGRFSSVSETVKVLAGVARGMEAVHMQKLIHLDLKPENVLLGPDNVPWVTDFGLSTSANLASMSASSAGGRGTLYYKAPELFAFPPVVHYPADVYAYAILCWVVCTGETTPYGRLLQSPETAMGSMLAQGVRPELPSGEDWRECTTAGLTKLIEACWVSEYEARPTFGGESGVVSQLDGLEVRLLKKDSDATLETMLARVWAAENEKAVAVELISEYDAAGASAESAAKNELDEEREGLETTRKGVEASSAAAQEHLNVAGHADMLQQMFTMLKAMHSDLESVKKDVQKGNVTLSSLVVDELYCPRLVFITPYVPEGQQGLVKRMTNTMKGLTHEKQRLVFLDPVTGAAAKCGKDGLGYVLKLPNEFLAKHGKQIKDGITVVKLAIALGRCTGLPIFDLASGLPTEVVTKAEARAVQEFELLLQRAKDAQAALCEETSEGMTSKEKRKSRKSKRASGESNVQVAATDNAYRALRSLVETQCEDPNLVLCQMTKMVAPDGTVEWVTEESKARFLDPETGGAKCLIWNQKSLSDD